MKTIFFFFVSFILICCPFSFADEGMWMPQQLDKLALVLKKMGIDIPIDQFSDLMGHPMNAIVSMDYCSGAFVSEKGLIITNHHCAFDSIQFNSTPEHDYIKNGFFAQGLEEEVPAARGLQMYVTIDFKDVTAEILKGTEAEMPAGERYEMIQSRIKEMVKEGEKEKGTRCKVAAYFEGIHYFLIKQKEIKDIRLVYAPPQDIGSFGGDIDNFMWPRHCGDFAFFRAYVGKDNSSSEYHKENVPYQPKHWLKVNPKGIMPGEKVIVAGYPGRTYRYVTSYEIKSDKEWHYPFMVGTLSDYLEILGNLSRKNKETDIKVASLKESLSNYLKYCQGMMDGLGRKIGRASCRERV